MSNLRESVLFTELNNILKGGMDKTATPMPPIFFEGQDSVLSCGRNAINNLLQHDPPVFNITDPRPINLNKLNVPINLLELCRELARNYTVNNVFDCEDRENYHFHTLQSALHLVGFVLIREYSKDMVFSVDFEKRPENDTMFYLINLGGTHWVSMRKIGYAYIYFDGMKKSTYNQPFGFSNKEDMIDYVLSLKPESVFVFHNNGIRNDPFLNLPPAEAGAGAGPGAGPGARQESKAEREAREQAAREQAARAAREEAAREEAARNQAARAAAAREQAAREQAAAQAAAQAARDQAAREQAAREQAARAAAGAGGPEPSNRCEKDYPELYNFIISNYREFDSLITDDEIPVSNNKANHLFQQLNIGPDRTINTMNGKRNTIKKIFLSCSPDKNPTGIRQSETDDSGKRMELGLDKNVANFARVLLYIRENINDLT